MHDTTQLAVALVGFWAVLLFPTQQQGTSLVSLKDNYTNGSVRTTNPVTRGMIRLQNTGQYAVQVFRTTSNNEATFVTEIAGNSGLDIEAAVGERFRIDFKDRPSLAHRIVFVTELGDTYFIYGNVAMKDFGGYGTNFSTLSLDPNLMGVDTAHFCRRNVVTTMNKGQIFERMNVTSGTDYEVNDDNILLKAGFTYGGLSIGEYSTKARMTYGYSNFTNGWNIALSGNFPVGKKGSVDVAGGFGYGESQTTQSSSNSVYAYQRFQSLTHQIAISPKKAYLHHEFVDKLRRMRTPEDAANFVRDYGTHYPSVVYYGGDYSAYIRMNSTDFMQAKSRNIDLQAEVSKSTPTTTTRTGDTKTKEAGGSHGGKIAFSYNEGSEERRIMERSESMFRVTGGNYSMNGDYSVARGNAAPLVADLRRIDELIVPSVVKDDISAEHLARAQALIRTAINQHIARNVPTNRPIHLPPPNIYEVSLKKMQVTYHMDDANANTRGIVSAATFSDPQLKNPVPQAPGFMWRQESYSLDFRFSPNHSKDFTNATQTIVHYPDPNTGRFNPLYMNVWSSVRERDDIAWAIDGAVMEANTGPMELHGLNLQPGGQGAVRSYDISSHGNGTIRVTYEIKKLENDFDAPGMLVNFDPAAPRPGTQPAHSSTPDADAEITLINSGGYTAKFRVEYSLEGQPKSYESGDVLVGWKHTLNVPPHARNVKVQAWASWGGWKEAHNSTDARAVTKCIKLFGVAWDPKSNNGCD